MQENKTRQSFYDRAIEIKGSKKIFFFTFTTITMKLAWKNWFNHISPPPGSGWVPSTSMTLICALLQLALKKGFYLTHKFRYQIKSRTYFFFAISLSSLLAASRLQFLRKFGNVIDWVTSCVEFSHDKCFIRLFRRSSYVLVDW